MKALYYGNNLQVLRDSIATESVDLIYLDPPFNSNATHNVCNQGSSGRDRMRGRAAACSHKETFEAFHKRSLSAYFKTPFKSMEIKEAPVC